MQLSWLTGSMQLYSYPDEALWASTLPLSYISNPLCILNSETGSYKVTQTGLNLY